MKSVLFALALALALPARGTETAAQPAPPAKTARYNLILISLGNVGTAHMSLYGYRRETTPSLDLWAKDAVVFENAFSPASWTLPVGTSLFTSRYPYAHGVNARGGRNMLNKSIPTLPEILQRAGFATAAFTGGLDYYKGFGHMRGFDTVPDNPDFTGYQTTLPQARSWLTAHERDRFFLFIHGYDAHCPFTPPAEPFRGSFTRDDPPSDLDTSRCWHGFRVSKDVYTAHWYHPCDLDRNSLGCKNVWPHDERVFRQADVDHLQNLYDEDVLSVDAQVGSFLASLSTQTLSRTIVVVYCEHGEMFAKHGRFGRGTNVHGVLYDDVVRVPLLVRLPQAIGARVRSMVEITDIMPTLLDLLGVPSGPGLEMQGKDLRSLLAGKDEPVHDRIFAGSTFTWDLDDLSLPPHLLFNESVRDPEWKLLREETVPQNTRKGRAGPRTEIVESLFNVAQDPEELNDLAGKRPDVVARLRGDLRRWRQNCLRLLSVRPPSTQAVPKSLLRDARDRGYW